MRKLIACTIFVFILTGCISVGNTPAPRFYMLHAASSGQVAEKFNIAPDGVIAIGPVEIPGYQDRPQIVTQDKFRMLNFAQLDRWGEPLDDALTRIILEDLTAMLPKATFGIFPCNFAIPVKYQVIMEVVRLESELNQDLLFVGQWSIVDAKSKEMSFSKRSEFRQAINPHNYAGLIDALSIVCASLSAEIAQELATIANQPKLIVDSAEPKK